METDREVIPMATTPYDHARLRYCIADMARQRPTSKIQMSAMKPEVEIACVPEYRESAIVDA